MSKRVAISVTSDQGFESIVDPRFSCASVILIIDSDTRKVNDKLEDDLTLRDVSAVISGRYGPKTYQAFTEKQIEMWIAPNGITAEEALDMLAAGTLQRCTVGDVGLGAGSRKQRIFKRWYKKYRARKWQPS